MRRFLLLVLAALAVASSMSATTVSSANRAWSITDLGIGAWSGAQAINNRGEIVGSRSTDYAQSAFVWRAGVANDLGVGHASVAVDINDRGQIAGNFWNASFGFTHGFVWRNGVVTEVGGPGELGLGLFGRVAGLNGRGQVVGYTESLPGRPGFQAFLWQDGRFTYLGDLGGGFSIAEAINDRGQVVGYSATSTHEIHAFLWANGVMTDLGATLRGESRASDINDKGDVVGYFGNETAQVFHLRKGAMMRLGTGYAYGINNSGDVVGTRGWVDGSSNHATLWQDGVVTDLGTLGNYSAAFDINDRGQAVGTSSEAYLSPTRWVLYSQREANSSGPPARLRRRRPAPNVSRPPSCRSRTSPRPSSRTARTGRRRSPRGSWCCSPRRRWS